MRTKPPVRCKLFPCNGLGVRWAALLAIGMGISYSQRDLWAAPSGPENSTEVQVVSGPVQTNLQGKIDKSGSTNDTLPLQTAVAPRTNQKNVSRPIQVTRTKPASNNILRDNPNRSRGVHGVSANMLSEEVIRLLASRRISVDFQEAPFRDAMRDLRDMLGINLIVYWPSVRQFGIDDEEPITLKLDNVVAEKVIDAVLAYVSSGSVKKLAWNVDKGVLEIDVEENLKEPYVLRSYYVGDLVAPPTIMMGMGGMGSGRGSRMGNYNASGSNFGYSGYNRNNRSGNHRGRGDRRNNRRSGVLLSR